MAEKKNEKKEVKNKALEYKMSKDQRSLETSQATSLGNVEKILSKNLVYLSQIAENTGGKDKGMFGSSKPKKDYLKTDDVDPKEQVKVLKDIRDLLSDSGDGKSGGGGGVMGLLAMAAPLLLGALTPFKLASTTLLKLVGPNGFMFKASKALYKLTRGPLAKAAKFLMRGGMSLAKFGIGAVKTWGPQIFRAMSGPMMTTLPILAPLIAGYMGINHIMDTIKEKKDENNFNKGALTGLTKAEKGTDLVDFKFNKQNYQYSRRSLIENNWRNGEIVGKKSLNEGAVTTVMRSAGYKPGTKESATARASFEKTILELLQKESDEGGAAWKKKNKINQKVKSKKDNMATLMAILGGEFNSGSLNKKDLKNLLETTKNMKLITTALTDSKYSELKPTVESLYKLTKDPDAFNNPNVSKKTTAAGQLSPENQAAADKILSLKKGDLKGDDLKQFKKAKRLAMPYSNVSANQKNSGYDPNSPKMANQVVWPESASGVRFDKMGGVNQIGTALLNVWNKHKFGQFGQPTVTSGKRKGNAKDSKHNTGDAFDIRMKNIPNFLHAGFYKDVKKIFPKSSGWWTTDHPEDFGTENTHIHIQRNGKKNTSPVLPNAARGLFSNRPAIFGEAGPEFAIPFNALGIGYLADALKKALYSMVKSNNQNIPSVNVAQMESLKNKRQQELLNFLEGNFTENMSTQIATKTEAEAKKRKKPSTSTSKSINHT